MAAQTPQPQVKNDEALLNDYASFRAEDDAARTQAEPSAFDDFISRRKQLNKDVPVDPTEQLDTTVTGAMDTGVQTPPDSPNPEFIPATETTHDMSNASAGTDEGGIMKAAKAVAKDVGMGLSQFAPRSLEGAVGGLKAIADLTNKGLSHAVYNPIQRALGASDEDIEAFNKTLLESGPLPSLAESLKPAPGFESVTGSFIKDISQFMLGFKGLDKLLKVGVLAKEIPGGISKASKFFETVSKGALADMAVFGEHEQRLSNLVESVPALQNPITDYLKADENDSLAEAKFKQGVEGLLVGAAGDGLIEGVKFLKSLKTKTKDVFDTLNDPKVMEEIQAMEREAIEQEMLTSKFNELGDMGNEKLFFRKPVESEDKLAKSFIETEGMTPEEVLEATKRTPKESDEMVINYARINSGDDVKNVIQGLANDKRYIDSVRTARRGVVSHKETIANASHINAFDELLERRVGQAYNAEEITAARALYVDTANNLIETAAKVSSPTASAVDAFNFRRMIAIFNTVQQEVQGVKAESGRALNAWAIPIQGNQVNIRLLEDIMANFGGVDASVELAKRITGVKLETRQLANVVKRTAYARTRDAIIEAWTMGLLSSPKTHMRNISGNTLTTVAEIPKRFVQSLIKDSGIPFEEPFYLAQGMFTSVGEAIRNSAVAFRTNESIISKMDLPRQRATSRESLDASWGFQSLAYGMDLYGRFVGISGRMLTACDEFGRTVLMNGEKHALAARDGVEKGLKGAELNAHVQNLVENPTPQMINQATDFANYNLFINQLGKSGMSFQSILAKHPTMRFVFPFVKTPINIFKYAFEHTPLAPLSSRIREDISGGGLKRAQALAKIGLGSSILSISTDQAMKGNITGNGPIDPKARKILKDSGWQPYSLRIGDKYYSYNGFEPIATWMGIAADMTEILSNYEAYDIKQQDDIDSLVTAATIALSQQVINKTFLQGFAETTEMLADPQRHAPHYLRKFVSSFIPNISNDLKKIDDPEIKHVASYIDAIKAKIPGLSKDVPARRNIFGEVVEAYYPKVGNEVADAGIRALMSMNPVYVSKVKEEPINRFLLNHGFCLDMPNKKIKYDGVYVDISNYPHIYNRYLEILGTYENPKYNGEKVKDFLNQLVKGEAVQSFKLNQDVFNEDDIKAYIQKVYADYKAEAMKQIRDEFPVIDALIDDAKVKKEKSNEVVESGLRRPIP